MISRQGLHSGCLIDKFFKSPAIVSEFDIRDWELLIAQARRERLLAKCHYVLEKEQLIACVPTAARHHLESSAKITKRHEQTVRWEVDRILYALRNSGFEIILLKGAAYLFAGKECSRGRLYTDIDLLVPPTSLADVEKRLMIQGWVQEKVSDYDQQYYRKWTHELPPLRHRRRNTILDVHHSITPNIFRYKINYDDFLPSSRVVGEGVRVLADEDMLIHAIVHLVNEEEFVTAYRDLHDLASLVSEFSTETTFWDRLLLRANELGFELPLFYGLTVIRKSGLAKVDDAVCNQLEKRLGMLSWPLRTFVAFMLVKVTRPKHPGCRGIWLYYFSSWLLYIRGHYLRMPLYLLIPHLVRKFFTKREQ